jgi:hypothetical protein
MNEKKRKIAPLLCFVRKARDAKKPLRKLNEFI